MACKTSYELHHNFPKIAEEAGFTFNIHKPRVHLDWNKIRSIDVDKVVRDRRFVTIEQSLNDVLDCVLESEFDVRILDEGVVKLFRLAQLTIEYQQFCRHHLDRSVILLREEVISIMQEIEKNKKELRNKDEEIRKLRKKTKHIYKPSLQYGNDNIAAMILKTLSNNDLASPGMGDKVQHYNKCKFCDKVFLNQLYLKGHMLRRHPAAESADHMNNTEAEQKTDQTQQYAVENSKLRNEIEELRNKLEDMRLNFEKTENKLSEMETSSKNEVPKDDKNETVPEKEVHEKNILDKFEEWKLEEHQKYKSEINLLREQILENINAMKDNRLEESQQQHDLEIIQPLHNIIKEQSTEILSLKQELTRAIKNIEKTNKELEAKKRIPLHIDASQQYENLGNDSNSHKPHYIRDKSNNLRLSDAATCTDSPEFQIRAISKQTGNKKDATIENEIQNNFLHKRQKSLEELHRKTQELLNTVSSSDTSSADEKHTSFVHESRKKSPVKQTTPIKRNREKNNYKSVKQDETKPKHQKKVKSNTNIATEDKKLPKCVKNNNKKIKKQERFEDEDSFSEEDTVEEAMVHSSPAKIVRAKITEEVNKRLVTVGVDPLKTGLKNDVFKKQRAHLRHEEEVKKKKNPSYEKTRHKILAFLDSKAAEESEATHVANNSVGDKMVRNFKFASVLSNVKNKALSLLKSSDRGNLSYRKSITGDAKGETTFRTPSPISPVRPRRASTDTNIFYNTRNAATKLREISKDVPKGNQRKAVKVEVARHKINYETDSDEKDSIDQIYEEKKSAYRQSNKSIDSLINSPIKRPATADMTSPSNKYINTDINLTRTQSAGELLETAKSESNIPEIKRYSFKENYQDSDVESTAKSKTKKFLSDENVFLQSNKSNTKGVLKNAPSNSSLSKKKVLFDLDANQTKSVSASPSQSISEQKDPNIDNVIESINLEDEWDISSIESHQVRASHENLTSRTNTKVAELTQRIESQLARRGDHKPPGVGNIDLLRGPATGGSNTSLGSSLLDDTEEPSPKYNHHPDNVSDIDLSEFSVDGISKEYKIK